jgi:hypothetical protein
VISKRENDDDAALITVGQKLFGIDANFADWKMNFPGLTGQIISECVLF